MESLAAIDRRVHVKRLVVPVAVAVVAVVAGVSVGLLSQPAASGQSALQPLAGTVSTIPNQSLGLLPASSQLSTRIVLSRIHVVAGSPRKGFVVVTNRGKPLKLWNHSGPLECRPGYAVVLTNKRFPPQAQFFFDCELRPLVIPSGVTRLPVTVPTTYDGCGKSAATKSQPKCLPGFRVPPLPAGTYRAVLVGLGLRLPAPKAVSVTLMVGVGTASTAAALSRGTLPPFGRVLGQLVRVGGFAPGAAVGIQGRVVLSLVGMSGSFTYPTARNGTFAATVPAGFTYRVTGYSQYLTKGRGAPCLAPHPIRVPSRVGPKGVVVVRDVEVVCSLK